MTTAIRFDPVTHEVLRETAYELGVTINFLVCRLVTEGLADLDLDNVRFTRPNASTPTPDRPKERP